MDDSKIFIVGANGQLGTALRNHYPNAQSADISELDITDFESVRDFDWSNVDILINAAAYTNVDGAETQEGRIAAWKVNATAVGYLAQIANDNDITLVHISTEYVFDGSTSPHLVDEPLSPLGVYAQSKAAGEIAASLAKKHFTIRVSWLIGEGHNFVRTMMGLADKDISPTVVADQIGRLTFTSTLTNAIDHLLTFSADFGTYQLSNQGQSTSWADVARRIFTLMQRDDLQVGNVTTEEYYNGKPGIAPRPLLSTMDLSKIEATGFSPTDWQEELKNYIKPQNS